MQGLFDINIIVTHQHNKPQIELRKRTTDFEIMKKIILAAWTETPIIIQPKFHNKIQAISSLQEKGIVTPKANLDLNTIDFEFLI